MENSRAVRPPDIQLPAGRGRGFPVKVPASEHQACLRIEPGVTSLVTFGAIEAPCQRASKCFIIGEGFIRKAACIFFVFLPLRRFELAEAIASTYVIGRSEETILRCPGCFREGRNEEPCPYCGLDPERPAPSDGLPVGAMLDGRYTLGGILGKPDGFGVEYRAWDRVEERSVVVEEFAPGMLADRNPEGCLIPHAGRNATLFGAAVEYFKEAYRLLSRPALPNTFQYAGLIEANRTVYAVREPSGGASLAAIATQSGPLEEAPAMAVLVRVLSALEGLHGAGILHGDLGPETIFLEHREGPGASSVVLGCSLSRRALAFRRELRPLVLRSGFAAPEWYTPREEADIRADVYGCAAVFYWMITGKEPPFAPSRRVTDPLVLPAAMGIRLSGPVEKALLKGLDVRREYRPSSVAAFRSLLNPNGEQPSDEIRSSEPVESPPAPPPEEVRKPEPVEQSPLPSGVMVDRLPVHIRTASGTVIPVGPGSPYRHGSLIGDRWKKRLYGLALLAGFVLFVAALYDRAQVPDGSPGPGVLEPSRPYPTAGTVLHEDSPSSETVLNAAPYMPSPLGGMAAIQAFIEYPPEALRKRVQGEVVVEIVVDRYGYVRDAVAIDGPGAGLNEEAVRVVRQTKFSSAYAEGRPVAVRMRLTVPFTLPRPERAPAPAASSTPAPRTARPPSPASQTVALAEEDLAQALAFKEQGRYAEADRLLRRGLGRLENLDGSQSRTAAVQRRLAASRAENRTACLSEAEIARRRGETPPACD